MLCPSAFQSPSGPLADLHWPVRGLWPETRPLFYQMELEMMKHMQEMRSNLELMDRLHRRIFDEIDPTPAPAASHPIITFQPASDCGGGFAVTLNTTDFAPRELSVVQVGRRLRVSGRSEKKQDDGQGSYSYRCQEFRQEFDLPNDVRPEAVTCSLNEGRLQIQAPKEPGEAPGERVVPIMCTPAVNSNPDKGPEPEKQGSQEEAVKD